MGRWLMKLSQAEKNTKTVGEGTDKTDENRDGTFSSVLSVPYPGEIENSSASATDLAMEAEERAAILEYDAGCPRAEAERLAREQLAPPAKMPPPPARSDPPPCEGAGRPHRVGPRDHAEEHAQSWRTAVPVPGPGVTITSPAFEVPPAEYDAHLDALIAAAGADTAEGHKLAYTKRKGWVVERGNIRIFTRGR